MSTADTFPSYSSLSPQITRIPIYRTAIIDYGNKVEQRIAFDSTARYRFEIEFNNMSSSNASTFENFFLSRKGKYDCFRFVDSLSSSTHIVRFEDDLINLSFFNYKLYTLNKITLIEVST